MKALLFFSFLLINSAILFADGWMQKSDFSGTARHRATGLTIGNKAYVGLGHYNGGGTNVLFDDWWEYDPYTNSWTQKADYAGGICYHATGFTIGNFGFVGTGRVSSFGNTLVKSFYKYDPVTNNWTAIADFEGSARRGAVAFTVNGIGYVGTGETTSGRSKAFYSYNPSTDIWTQVSSLTGSSRTSAVAFSIESSGYVGTGNTSSGSTNDFWEYKPSVDQWIQRADCSPIARQEAAGFQVNGKGYILTGDDFSSGNNFKDMWEFNPATNSWSQIADFQGTARRYLTAFSFGNYAYAGLGTNGTNFQDYWIFDQSLAYLQENLANINFSAYPNPSIGTVHFKLNGIQDISTDNLEVTLFNTNGEMVSTEKIQAGDNVIQLDHLTNGSYFYSLSFENTPLKKGKLIINK